MTWHVKCKWLSRDPIGENGGINLYGYVLNNPILLRDVFGLDTTGDVNLDNDAVRRQIIETWDKSKQILYSSSDGWKHYLSDWRIADKQDGWEHYFTKSGRKCTPVKKAAGIHGDFSHTDPPGTNAGYHAHWTGDEPSQADRDWSSSNKRPEYIIRQNDVIRVDPKGGADVITPRSKLNPGDYK